MTYKTHDPERQARSSYYQSGLLDGIQDRRRMQSEPPKEVRGMDPQRCWSFMYQAGYEHGLNGDQTIVDSESCD